MDEVFDEQLNLTKESVRIGKNGLIGLNRDADGRIIHDELYNSWIEGNRLQKEKRLRVKAEKETVEKARRDALTPQEKITEDIRHYLNEVSYDGEYDIDQLAEMFKQYNDLK